MLQPKLVGPKGRPFVGNLIDFRQDRLKLLLDAHTRYGDLVPLRLGPSQLYLVSHPDMIRELLVTQAEKFHKGPGLKRGGDSLVGNGLLTSEGDFHKKQRQMAQPAFHHARINAYAATMVDYTERAVGRWKNGTTFDFAHEMMALTRDIVAKTLFNMDVSADSEAIGEAITTIIELGTPGNAKLMMLPWESAARRQKRSQSVALMDRIMKPLIRERAASGEDKGDLLSMLLAARDDQGQPMSDQQLRDEALTIFVAGHETTANATAWTFYLLAQHPEVEAKLVTELSGALNGRSPTAADLAALPYTEMIVKESMRLYPPAWVIGREAISDIELGGYKFSKGTRLMMSPYVMHRDARYFAEPNRFMPERWTPDFEKSLPRFAYFPFGGGPRVCIGNSFAMMEARLILATIAQCFHLALTSNQTVAMEPLITLRPKNGIQMMATRRVAAIH